jgi:hypothetical protein
MSSEYKSEKDFNEDKDFHMNKCVHCFRIVAIMTAQKIKMSEDNLKKLIDVAVECAER